MHDDDDDSVFQMAFVSFYFFVLATKVKWITLKRRRNREDVVISAYICSDTGELAKRSFRFSTRITDDILGTKKKRKKKQKQNSSTWLGSHGNFLTFHMWSKKKKERKEEEISFYSAFVCSLQHVGLLEYANVKDEQSAGGAGRLSDQRRIFWFFFVTTSSATRDSSHELCNMTPFCHSLHVALIANGF